MARALAKQAQTAIDADLEDLKRKATVSMDMLDKARRNAEMWQNYYDGIQWTDAEKRALEARGQPALVFNHIKPSVNAIIGIVERGKTDPKAWGRGPNDQQSAEVATDGLRYVADVSRFNVRRRDALKDFLVWGYCAAIQEVDESNEINYKRIRPEEFFYDPYSRDGDFGDARYDGIAKWMDENDLIALYPEAEKSVTLTFAASPGSSTYQDRPRNGWSWVDTKARRLMVFEMYHRKGMNWYKSVFVAGGILESVPSPFLDSKTKTPKNPIIAQSAYVDTDNCRYGVVRDMIGPQDAINKARSKAVHILNVAKLRVDPGLLDVDAVRREYAKPDGVIEAREGQIEELGDRQLAPAHLELLRDAKDEMRRQAPSPGIVGRQGAGQSGRAILAEQQAGLTEQAPLLAQFDDWTLRCYRGMWDCIKQFWTSPKWVRVTDDEMSPRFVGLNVPTPVVDPMTGQPQIGQDGQPVTQVENSPADMDVDIVIDSTPDTAVIQEEQFQKLAELAQAGMPIPPDVIIEASSLPRKKQLLDKLKQAQEQQSQQPTEAANEQAKAQVQLQSKQAMAQIDAEAHAQELQRQDEADARKAARAEALEQQKFNNAMSLLQAQQETEAYKAEQTVAVDTRKQQAAIEAERAKKQLDLEHQNHQHEMAFHFESKKQQQVVDAERQKGAAMAEAQTPAIEKLHERLDKVGEALAKLARPKRIVRDPVTGEKTAEYVN